MVKHCLSVTTSWKVSLAKPDFWVTGAGAALQTARQHFPVFLPLLCAGTVAFSYALQREIILLIFIFF